MVDAATQTTESRCPRCGGAFHCGVDDAGPCVCRGIALTPGTLAGLHARFAGCLCLNCLVAIAAEPSLAEAPASR